MSDELIEYNLNVERLKEFWEFVHERHQIYIRRFEQKKPWPWTKDPILQNIFFTNIYRELDKGTVYLKNNVLDRGEEVDEFFEILVYRQFNNVDTYEAMKNDLSRDYGNWDDWENKASFLKLYAEQSKRIVFTDAHMTTGAKFGGFPNKIDNVCWLMNQHWKNRLKIFKSVLDVKNLKSLCELIATLDGYGMFLAYEVATDMGYSKRLGRFAEDDWANAGPGCRKAIDLLIPGRKGLRISYEDVMFYLRKNQKEYLDALGIDFPGKELTLRNVEHSLCEYYKYWRAKYEGKARRKYSAPHTK